MNLEIPARKVSDVPGREYCVHPALIVLRTWRSGHLIRRRRKCLECGVRFTTSELIPATNDKNRTAEPGKLQLAS